MTKAELIEEVSRVVEMTRKDSEVIVEAIFDSVVKALRTGDKAALRTTVEDLKVLIPYLRRRSRILLRAMLPLMTREWPATVAADLADRNSPILRQLMRFALR